MTEIERILSADVDLQALLKKLDFADDNVEQASLEQAKLFVGVSSIRIQKMRARQKYASMVEVKKAALGLRFRKEAREEGEKLTEAHISARMARDKKLRALEDRLAQAEAEEEFAKLLVEAFRMRRDALRIIGDHRNNEALALRSGIGRTKLMEDVTNARERLRKKYPGRRVTK
jgi:hypothetical protein